MNTPSSRQRIFAYLQEHPGTTAAQISAALHLTRADIRYHLNALLQTGSVESSPAAAPDAPRTRGRPTLAYRLRSEAHPDNLAVLADALLTLVPNSSGGAFEQIAAALLDRPPAGRNLTQRIAALVQQLNRWNYQARWEARASAPVVILRNCPYAAILPQHPELCQLDRLLIQRGAGRPARQSARIDLRTARPPACLFLILAASDQPREA